MIFNDNTTAGGGVATGSASTNTAGVFTYYVGCVTPEGCETPAASRVPVTLTVNAFPSAATVSITPTGSPVCSGVITLSVTSCAATDSVKIWDVTTGMTLLGAGKGTSFSVDITRTPATTTTYSFAARCISAKGCTNPAAPATASVSVNPTIKTPVATIIDADNKTSRCQGEIQVALYFNTDCGALATLWYNTPTGGTPIASLTNVTPTAPAEYKYYASCKDLATGCESPIRAEVKYTVNPAGSTPTAVSMTAALTTVNVSQDKVICSTTGTAIVFTGCPSGETLLVSVDSNPYSATLPTVMADGIKHNYRVRCQAGSGATACTGPESGVMSLTAYSVLTTAPTASVVPAVVCSASAPVAFGGSSNCGALATVWFDATTNTQLLSLPSMTPTTPGTYSYYAKCVNGGGCMSPASATTSLTVVGNSTAPTITSVGGTEVCTGVNVTLTTNCPSGSVVKWSTGDTNNALPLVSNVPQVRAVTAKCVITVGSTTCESPVSATTTVVWKTFDLTIINIGSSRSGVKPGSNVPKSAWAANFVTVDAGPSLQSSSQGNPSVFFTENPNKGADRFWTVHVETCALGDTGSVSYDMLVTPEAGLPLSYNTVENNAPYLMYANRDGFTELYAHNHGAYGFTHDPRYAQGLPKGLYKLSIRYWSQKGLGLYPAVRKTQGTELAYQEYWFRIQSQNGIGSGAAREGVTENTEAPFVTMGQNPVTRTLSLTINGAKGQDVKLNLVDASGRSIKVSSVTPETNTHREEIDMTSQNTGMYFIQVSTPSKRAALKVLKVSQD
ncbi:hypothetical protein FHS57_000411 [Runella defluvii]|uniref:T9SS type A sorting domain-containing protein n=2 Tax=Runella defluvii TaxID=370973 RepID=A0A7W6ENE9_9BACT|nr:hypothetical protein [Runella defluvii]